MNQPVNQRSGTLKLASISVLSLCLVSITTFSFDEANYSRANIRIC